jgi:hypothetical protein
LSADAYQLVEVDFSLEVLANNNPEFGVRITFSGASSSGTTGNNRFDNITLEGYTITSNLPEQLRLNFKSGSVPDAGQGVLQYDTRMCVWKK